LQFVFSNHVLDTSRQELSRSGEGVAVEPQVFDLLLYLLENRDRVVSKDDLFDHVWEGRIVSESTLTSRINAVRKAVGDTGRDQRLVRTIARKGFRFIGDVSVTLPEAKPEDAPPKPSHHSPDDTQQPRAALSVLDRPAIAVLPFTNMSGEAEQEYFSDGISEDIITALSKLRWFYVIARNSSFIYKGKSVHLKQVGQELGVNYVVEGSVRKDGDRVRITVQLNDVATGSHLWAERYDRGLADVFAVQDEITQAIVAAIEPQLYAAENFRSLRKAPDSMDAWDLVMRALSHYWRVTRQDNVVAQALLEKAIDIDPHYGQALGVLAGSRMFGAHMGWEPMAKAMPVAERCALAAIHADSEDPWAHFALAGVYLLNRRFEDCLAEFELTLRLNPNYAGAHDNLAYTFEFQGKVEEAKAEFQAALAIDPDNAARSVRRNLLRRRRLFAIRRPQLRGSDPPVARGFKAARRLCRRPPRADRGRRHGRA